MITQKDIDRQYRQLQDILSREDLSVHGYRRLICARSAIKPRKGKRVTATQLASLLEMSPQTVRNIRCAFGKLGLKAVIHIGGSGGRHREKISFASEQTLLRRSCSIDKLYGCPAISVRMLKRSYRKATRAEPLNYRIYRLLRRHGCRRIAVGLYSPPALT